MTVLQRVREISIFTVGLALYEFWLCHNPFTLRMWTWAFSQRVICICLYLNWNRRSPHCQCQLKYLHITISCLFIHLFSGQLATLIKVAEQNNCMFVRLAERTICWRRLAHSIRTSFSGSLTKLAEQPATQPGSSSSLSSNIHSKPLLSW